MRVGCSGEKIALMDEGGVQWGKEEVTLKSKVNSRSLNLK